jgi:hypothetical protein
METKMDLIKIEKKESTQLIIGQANFIKTVEDIYEALVSSVPSIRFGLAFVEASGKCLVRSEGNDSELTMLAEKNAYSIGAGHAFVILFEEAYPINVMNRIKEVDEVAGIYCATSNTATVVVADVGDGRAILGVADGSRPAGIERDGDRKDRKKFLRDVGYKL